MMQGERQIKPKTVDVTPGSDQALEQQLMSQTVDNLTYEQLTDTVKEKGQDLEGEFLKETLEWVKDSNDELWRMQWDATLNLRILNKFYFEAMRDKMADLSDFIKGQIENLRSNNSRNSLQLFSELYSENKDKCEATDGRKMGEPWEPFTEKVLPTVLAKTCADKAFIAKIAMKGVLSCVEACPSRCASRILIQNAPSKNLKLAEFSV